MTLKEKAYELINKFKCYSDVNHNGNFDNAKQCALIAVIEIIDLLSKDINPLVNYWHEVKKEMERL